MEMALRIFLRGPNPVGSFTVSADFFTTSTRIAAAPGTVSPEALSGSERRQRKMSDA